MTNLGMCILIFIVNFMLGFAHYRESARIEEVQNLFANKNSRASAQVIRDGTSITIDAKEIVPGDIIILKAN